MPGPHTSGTGLRYSRDLRHVANTWTADQTLSDGVDIVLGTTTGSKIGTATTQKLGFFNATPVAQRTDTGAITDNTGGAVDGTLDDVGTAFSQATLNNNFADLADRVNDLRTALRDLGLMA